MAESVATTAVTRTNPPRTKGGARPGSGRKPKPRNPTLLMRAYALLDEATIPAIQAVVDLLKAGRAETRLSAAKIILAKTIPDQTTLALNALPPAKTQRLIFVVNVNGEPRKAVHVDLNHGR